jgi:hypothetical protein
MFFSEFKNSISYTKPLDETIPAEKKDLFEEDGMEKKYEKVLNHIRLSNGDDRPNTEQFYVKKIEALGNENKVTKKIKN